MNDNVKRLAVANGPNIFECFLLKIATVLAVGGLAVVEVQGRGANRPFEGVPSSVPFVCAFVGLNKSLRKLPADFHRIGACCDSYRPASGATIRRRKLHVRGRREREREEDKMR